MKGAFVFAVTSCFLVHSTFAKADCITLKKCSGSSGCLTQDHCSWCHPDGGASKLGYCTAKGKCGDGTQVGTLKKLLGNELVIKEENKALSPVGVCPAGGDKDSALVLDKNNCDDCLKANPDDYRWCQIDIGTARGGVCLNNKKKDSTDCLGLKNSISGTSHTAYQGVCPKDKCVDNLSCKGCKDKKCVWCGLTLKDKTAFAAGGGTQLGMCVDPAATKGDNACAAKKDTSFGQMDKVLQYKLSTHDYTTEVVEFDLNNKGWATGSCTASVVDPLAFDTTTAKCDDCTKKEAKWCRVVTLGAKEKKLAEGGICVGKDATVGTALCKTLEKPASKDYHHATATYVEKCSAGVSVTAASSALFAVGLASFVMFA